jgi:quinol monooxygenase YgiN
VKAHGNVPINRKKVMSIIKKDANIFTLIITLDVQPQTCDALLKHIIDETNKVMRFQSGFIAANLHRNEESTRIVNYAQWENREAWEAMRTRDEIKPLAETVEQLTESIDPVAYEVVFTEERQ